MNEDMKKFRRRVVRSAVLRSALSALGIAGGVLVVSALASWIFAFKEGIWLSVGLFAGVFFGASLLFYFVKYRPSAKDVAASIDALGLEERIITRLELEGDESYIARLQREDAQKALSAADHTLIKIAASSALIVAAAVSMVFALGALTVDSLYTAGVIPGGLEVAAEGRVLRDFKLNYTAPQNGGKIYYWVENGIGEEVTDTIIVKEGEDAPPVIVVPDEGYAFIGWSDGLYDVYRQERAISRSLTVRAKFEAVEYLEDLADDPQNGDQSSQPGQMDPDMPPQDPQRPNDPTGAGNHSDTNKQINDGQTYYGDEYGNAYNDAMDRLGEGSDIPENLQGGISGYLDSIGKGGSDEGGSSGEGSGSTENP